jgi:hypothetical protein
MTFQIELERAAERHDGRSQAERGNESRPGSNETVFEREPFHARGLDCGARAQQASFIAWP